MRFSPECLLGVLLCAVIEAIEWFFWCVRELKELLTGRGEP